MGFSFQLFHGLLTKELYLHTAISFESFQLVDRQNMFVPAVFRYLVWILYWKNVVSSWFGVFVLFFPVLFWFKQRSLFLWLHRIKISDFIVFWKYIVFFKSKKQAVMNENWTIFVTRQRKPVWFTSWISYHSSFSLWFGPSVLVIVWRLLASGFRVSCRR